MGELGEGAESQLAGQALAGWDGRVAAVGVLGFKASQRPGLSPSLSSMSGLHVRRVRVHTGWITGLLLDLDPVQYPHPASVRVLQWDGVHGKLAEPPPDLVGMAGPVLLSARSPAKYVSHLSAQWNVKASG